MDLETLLKDLQAADENRRNPWPRLQIYLKTRAQQYQHDIKDDTYAVILSGVYAQLAAEFVPATATAVLDENRLCARFDQLLLEALRKGRERGGILRGWRRADVRNDWTVRLNDLAWGGVECHLVFERLLPEGDVIVAATPRTITTSSGLVITRQDLLIFCPPHVWASQFARSLVSEKEIAKIEGELEAKAIQAARPNLVFDPVTRTFQKMAGPSDERDPG